MSTMEQRLAGHLRPTRHSETLLANELANKLAASRGRIYRFGFGQSPFPVPAHVAGALNASVSRKEYTDVQGLAELRRAIANFHGELDGLGWQPEELVVGPGSKILLFCLLAALDDVDVALPAPSWVSYEPQALLAGHRVLRIQTRGEDHWQLTPASLEKFCAERRDGERPLVLVLNYPGNPDGRTYDADTQEKFAGILRRHRVLVLSDEIYGPLDHRGTHHSIAHAYPEGTVVSTGLSKWCGAGGWRLGAVRIPPELGDGYFQGVLGVASETYSSASTPVQLAAIAAYRYDNATRDYLDAQRSILSDVGNRCADRLQAAGVRVSSPQGGFYLFPDFSSFAGQLAKRGIDSGGLLTRKLLEETGVALLPGSAFGMPGESLTTRLAYVDFDGDAALRTGRADTAHMDEGIDTLCRWLAG